MKRLITLAVIMCSLSGFAQKEENEDGRWEFKLYYGFTKTNYFPTDIHLKTDEFSATLVDQDLVERNSAHWYNILEKGRKLKDILKFIDEPTTTMGASVSNEHNTFGFYMRHPKYMKSFLYRKVTGEDGSSRFEFSEIGESDDFSQEIPEGWNLGYLGETHKHMDWGLYYARRMYLLRSGKWKITYNPGVEFGISTGQARSVQIIPGQAWNDFNAKPGIQGYTIGVSHRIEFSRGRLNIYVGQTLLYSVQSVEFWNTGSARYKAIAIPTSFGISYDIFEWKPKRK